VAGESKSEHGKRQVARMKKRIPLKLGRESARRSVGREERGSNEAGREEGGSLHGQDIPIGGWQGQERMLAAVCALIPRVPWNIGMRMTRRCVGGISRGAVSGRCRVGVSSGYTDLRTVEQRDESKD